MQCSVLQLVDLPGAYKEERYQKIYENTLYNSTSMVMMQVHKFLQTRLPAENIQIIFSFCYSAKPFFRKCDKNCPAHETILNRGYPEFEQFKITSAQNPVYLRNIKGKFTIEWKQEKVTDKEKIDSVIKKKLIKMDLTESDCKIVRCNNILYISTMMRSNSRGKLPYNNQPYICKHSDYTHTVSIYDPKEKVTKASFTFKNDEYILDYYYADGLFFITLIDEHIYNDMFSGNCHDRDFPDPQNHRLQIYDIQSKELVHTQKLPLPKEYRFECYNYLLDYADSTGYYLYDFPRKAIMHYTKGKIFDIEKEPENKKSVKNLDKQSVIKLELSEQIKLTELSVIETTYTIEKEIKLTIDPSIQKTVAIISANTNYQSKDGNLYNQNNQKTPLIVKEKVTKVPKPSIYKKMKKKSNSGSRQPSISWITKLKNILYYNKKVIVCTAGLGVATLLAYSGIFQKYFFKKIFKIIS